MPAKALIELRDVDIVAGTDTLVRRLSLDIASGRVLAVVSERLKVRAAIARVLAGEINGYRVAGDLTMDGRELVGRVTAQGMTQARTHVARIDGPSESRARVREVATAAALAAVQCAAAPDERVHSLAEADRIRIAFAVALSASPRLIVLELPYGADASSVYPVYSDLLHQLGRDDDLAFVVCTDSLAVAADVADDVLVTLDGCAVEYGSVYDICLRPVVPYTQDLLRVTPSPHRAMADYPAFVDLARREGCPWVLNCRAAVVRACAQVPPVMQSVAPGHDAACHLLGGHHVA